MVILVILVLGKFRMGVRGVHDGVPKQELLWTTPCRQQPHYLTQHIQPGWWAA